jgi:hypothetical protein
MRWGDRAGHTARRLIVLTIFSGLLASGLAGLGPGATASPPAPRPVRVAPVLPAQGFADPSVVRFSGGYVALATGIGAPRATATNPRGPWRMRSRAMPRVPAWARSAQVWASDMMRIHHRWLLYYSVPVRGLGREGRCIGVATSRSALGRFRPVGHRPLVCPRAARTRRAWDTMAHRGRNLPRGGVIDPSVFRGASGRPYLLYKTQGYPASIRVLPLSPGGARARHHARSRQLVRSRGIVENPVMLRRHGRFVLLTSEGFYGDCHYRTTWRRSKHLMRWKHARPHTLLRRAGLGVCGPGGADVVTVRGRRSLVFFHGWTCWGGRLPCPPGFRMTHARGLRAHRTLFAAHLRWTHHGKPRVRRFLQPR